MSFIGVDIAGIKEIQDALKKLPDAVADAGVENANKYMLEVEKKYAPSHRGQPFKWQNAAQRKAAMAAMRKQGGPPYRRTQTLRRGWKLLGNGRNQILVNEVPYARFVKDPPIPGHAAREWTSLEQDVKKSTPKLVAKFEEGARKAIKRIGII